MLHDELDQILADIDAGALEAVQAGYEAVSTFIESIDPEPLAAELDEGTFAALKQALDELDPEALLAEPLAALDEVRGALDGIDLAALLAPVEEALDTVKTTIESLDPAELVAPVEEVLAGARTAIEEALHLEQWAAQLEAVDAAVAAFVERFDPTGPLADLQTKWSALLAPLREHGPSIAGSLLGGLLGPGSGLAAGGGFPEVIAGIRGEHDGSEVVRGRLTRAADRSRETQTALAALDLPAVTADIRDAYAALEQGLDALPEDSMLRTRLAVTVAATDPREDLTVVTGFIDRAIARFVDRDGDAALTPAVRSEVSLVPRLRGVLALLPVVDMGRRLLAVLGITTPIPHPAAPSPMRSRASVPVRSSARSPR